MSLWMLAYQMISIKNNRQMFQQQLQWLGKVSTSIVITAQLNWLHYVLCYLCIYCHYIQFRTYSSDETRMILLLLSWNVIVLIFSCSALYIFFGRWFCCSFKFFLIIDVVTDSAGNSFSKTFKEIHCNFNQKVFQERICRSFRVRVYYYYLSIHCIYRVHTITLISKSENLRHEPKMHVNESSLVYAPSSQTRSRWCTVPVYYRTERCATALFIASIHHWPTCKLTFNKLSLDK